MNLISGVKAVAVDIEQNWFIGNKDNIPERLYKTLDYIIEKAEKLNIELEPHDRAVVMIKNKGNQHKLKFQGKEI